MPVAHQDSPLLPFLSWARERKPNKRILRQGKDRETSLHYNHHGQKRLVFSLIYYQSDESRVMQTKPKSYKHLLLTCPFVLDSTFFQIFSTFSLLSGAGECGMGIEVVSSHVSAIAYSSAGRLLILFPSSSVGALPWQTVLHELLQYSASHGSSQTAPI